MSMPPVVDLKSIRGKVDFGIITMREDEFKAVLKRFRPYSRAVGERQYNIAEFDTPNGPRVAAVIRTVAQGESEAQQAATDILHDLDAASLVLVGIAGAKPETEFTLGDVVVATRLHDFSLTAALAGGRTEYVDLGGPAHKWIQVVCANLLAEDEALGDWNGKASIGMEPPPVEILEANLIGEEDWKDKVRKALAANFRAGHEPRRPLVTAASIVTANVLMKDPALFEKWLAFAKDVKAVETELSGVYAAARSVQGDRPVIAIRGISDVIGFQRDPLWTGYACETAAAFTRAFLGSGLLDMPAGRSTAREAAVPQPVIEVIKFDVCQIEPDTQGRLKLEVRNTSRNPMLVRGLRIRVTDVWELPKWSTTRLTPIREPDLPRLDIPPTPESQVEFRINRVVPQDETLSIDCNLFSREAKCRQPEVAALVGMFGGHTTGVILFHLNISLETESADIQIGSAVINLVGYGYYSTGNLSAGYVGRFIDGAQQALATMSGETRFDPAVRSDVEDYVQSYLAARRSSS
jgi:nucleoside phosphorylase